MQRRVPDITKIHNTIGWAPKYNLNQILDDVIEFERLLSIADDTIG
jgi:nucleoside-diphosphate-sugar epimerase